MKLQSGYGLKEKIRDNRRLTLRLQWYHLTTTEAKQVSAQIEQMAQKIVEGQNMLFLGTINQRNVEKKELKVPWKDKKNLLIRLDGYVRTDETIGAQVKRIREKSALDANGNIASPKIRRHPLYPKIQQQAVQLIKDSFGKNETDYVTECFPTEVICTVRRRYCDDYTYSINCNISVSAYALGYVLQDLLAQFQAYLRDCYQNTGLFAGYILYETKHLGAHSYYHMFPGKFTLHHEEYLEGYEWAAYLSGDLVRKLTSAQLAELEQYADITKENNGLFYQTKCDITEYGLEQKRRYESIFQAILKPGFYCMPAFQIYRDKMQPADGKAYLLREKVNKYFWLDAPYYVGFFYKIKPEETPAIYHYNILEEIDLKD